MNPVHEESDIGYQIADTQRAESQRAPRNGPPRSLAFPEGMSSHTKVATPDPIETNLMKVANVETPPGIKVGSPEPSRGMKVAKPSMCSVTGDFRLPIRLSGSDPKERRDVGLKLYATSLDPTQKIGRKRS